MPQGKIKELKKYKIFQGVKAETLQTIAHYFEEKTFKAGDIIFNEDEKPDYLYLIKEGVVEIYKSQERFVLIALTDGDEFGAMPLIDQEPRSATVQALTHLVVVRAPIDILNHEIFQSDQESYQHILRNLFNQHTSHLRYANEMNIKSFREKLKEASVREQTNDLFTYVVMIMSLYGLALHRLIDKISLANSAIFSMVILLIFAFSFLVMILHSKQPWSFYGFRFENWAGIVRESLLWSGLFIAAIIGLKWLLIGLFPSDINNKLFDPPLQYTSQAVIEAGMIYVLLVFLQEFIARGVLQSSLQNFLHGKWVTAKAIILSSLLFSITHIHFSTVFSLIVLVPSLFWGVLYSKQGSLLGVCVSHFIIGAWVFFLMGFPGITEPLLL